MLNECNGCEYKCSLSHIDICTLGSPCPHQRSTPMTNEEYFKFCTTEEFAKWIANNIKDTIILTHGNREYTENITSEKWWVEWLKQPHKDGE